MFNTIQMNIKGTTSKNVDSKFSKLNVAHHGFHRDFEGTPCVRAQMYPPGATLPIAKYLLPK